MGEWIGFLGGLLMVLLVLLFGWLLLSETGVVSTGRQAVLRSASRLGGWICAGILLLLTGALYRYLASSPCDALDVSSLWGSTACAVQWPFLRDGASLSELAAQGVLPLTALLYRGLGTLLFGAKEQAALYLGLLCGGISFFSMNRLWKSGCLALCLPGAVLLALPSSFSLLAVLWLVTLLLERGGHRRAAPLTAVAAALSHPFGAAVLAVTLIGPLRRLPEWARCAVLLLLSACVSAALHRQGWYFELFPLAGLILLPLTEALREKPVFPLVPLCLSLCAAALTGCML